MYRRGSKPTSAELIPSTLPSANDLLSDLHALALQKLDVPKQPQESMTRDGNATSQLTRAYLEEDVSGFVGRVLAFEAGVGQVPSRLRVAQDKGEASAARIAEIIQYSLRASE
ncbi:hypothetical protein HKX48_005230 [Thoreauomyces humboldtii]|nr:hypothetical protein HKX48_005230 [Thoreauomyces humboldtii]